MIFNAKILRSAYISHLAGFLLAGGLLIIFVSWVLLAGKDLNWDALNYHVYGFHSLVGGRIAQDFFPASIQSYLNPLGYFPFYLLVRTGQHSITIALVLTMIHSFNIYLIYRLSKVLLSDVVSSDWFVFLGVLLALSTSLWWGMLGSSFIDLIVTLPMLLSILVLVSRFGDPHFVGDRHSTVFFAGMLMGAATGLKLSCAVYAVAGVVFLLPQAGFKVSARSIVVYILGGAIGFLLLYGYWGCQLWGEFGNPFFPFFNNVFQSGDFLLANINIRRFIPESLVDVVTFPAKMALPAHWVYTESINPDIKPMVVWLMAILMPVFAVYKKVYRASSFAEEVNPKVWKLLLFWLISYLGWVASSANGRYGVLLLLLSGPLIVLCALSLWRRGAKIVCVTLLLLQLLVLTVVGIPRWGEGEWTEQWYSFSIPQILKSKPVLFLSIGKNTMSFLTLELHSGSAFANVSGQYALALDSPGGDKLLALLARHSEVRSLLPYEADFTRMMSKGSAYAAGIYSSYQNAIFGRLGYQVTNECDFIRQLPVLEASKTILSCKLRKSKEALSTYQQSEKGAAPIFSAVESLCPHLLQPAGGVPEKMIFGWQKFYLNSDAKVKIMDGLVLLQKTRTMNPDYLGTVKQVQANDFGIDRVLCE